MESSWPAVEKKLPRFPRRPLTNRDIEQYAQVYRIPYFRGVFMRNDLPASVNVNESGVVNLDDRSGPGTHWVAYKKRGTRVEYFDSYGDLRPPVELLAYLCTQPGTTIQYNTTRYQDAGAWNCGQYSLRFLLASHI